MSRHVEIRCDKAGCNNIVNNRGKRTQHFIWVQLEGEGELRRHRVIMDICEDHKQEWRIRQKNKDEAMQQWFDTPDEV